MKHKSRPFTAHDIVVWEAEDHNVILCFHVNINSKWSIICCFWAVSWYLCNLIKVHWSTAGAMFTTPHSTSLLLHHVLASCPCPPPQLSWARMLLAKHSQLQPVNCLISHQSIYPNKERWRSGTKVEEQRVRINGSAAMSVKQANAGYSLSLSF